MAINAGGIKANNPPAVINPYSVVFFVTNSVITTVKGFVVGAGAMIKGIMNWFQVFRKIISADVKRTG